MTVTDLYLHGTFLPLHNIYVYTLLNEYTLVKYTPDETLQTQIGATMIFQRLD